MYKFITIDHGNFDEILYEGYDQLLAEYYRNDAQEDAVNPDNVTVYMEVVTD